MTFPINRVLLKSIYILRFALPLEEPRQSVGILLMVFQEYAK